MGTKQIWADLLPGLGACRSPLAFVSFAGYAVESSHMFYKLKTSMMFLATFLCASALCQGDDYLRICLEGRYSSLCKHPPPTPSKLHVALEAGRRENLRTCLDGRYPSLCKQSLLSQEEAVAVNQAERRENLKTCLDGRYPSLCKQSLLSQEEAVAVNQAERRENLKTCLDGRYPSLCKQALLSREEATAVNRTERRENYKICRDGRFPSLCRESLNEVETTSAERSVGTTPLAASTSHTPRPKLRESPSTVRISSQIRARTAINRAEGVVAIYKATPPSADARPRAGPSCAENGSCYGDPSVANGIPKTVHVNGYYRRDGTYVRGHYRSFRRR
jgi:hypothetical protein